MHLYGLIVGCAAVVWWSLAEKLEVRLKKEIPWLLGLALLGARAYHVLEYWDYYQQDIWAIGRLWEGGLSIWGAIGAGIGGMLILKYKLKLTSRELNERWASAIFTPLPLSQAIGRLANGVNGEFANKVWGIPWWGAEALLDLGLFGIMWGVSKRWRSVVYLGGYILIRLALQPYRE